jgi:hypothetical protein
MTKRRKRKPQPFPMKIANDSRCWLYNSLEEALATNVDALALLIQAGSDQEEKPAEEAKPAEVSPDLAKGA